MVSKFEVTRAILLDEPSPESFTIQDYLPLSQAISENYVYAQEPCLVAKMGDTTLVLPTLALVYHHVAQGQLYNIHWMVAYCCMCNSGSLFDATYKRQTLQFAAQGYYDVMVLIADDKSQSYWNHLTGECVKGALEGASLTRYSGLRQMKAYQALSEFPDALFTTITLSPETEAIADGWNKRYRLPDSPDYGQLYDTLGAEDTRLSQYDMGLGIWTNQTQRYYPISKLYEAQSVIIDDLNGRKIVVCIDEEIGLPTVFYFDTDHASARGNEIMLGEKAVYRKGILYVDGQVITPERPNHNAIRWYGFASIFPNCEIYGENKP